MIRQFGALFCFVHIALCIAGSRCVFAFVLSRVRFFREHDWKFHGCSHDFLRLFFSLPKGPYGCSTNVTRWKVKFSLSKGCPLMVNSTSRPDAVSSVPDAFVNFSQPPAAPQSLLRIWPVRPAAPWSLLRICFVRAPPHADFSKSCKILHEEKWGGRRLMTNLRMDEIELQNLQNSAKFSSDEQPQNGRNSIAKSAKFCKIFIWWTTAEWTKFNCKICKILQNLQNHENWSR